MIRPPRFWKALDCIEKNVCSQGVLADEIPPNARHCALTFVCFPPVMQSCGMMRVDSEKGVHLSIQQESFEDFMVEK